MQYGLPIHTWMEIQVCLGGLTEYLFWEEAHCDGIIVLGLVILDSQL